MSSNLAMKHGNLHEPFLFNLIGMWWSVCFSCLQGSHICHEWQGTEESSLGEISSSWVKKIHVYLSLGLCTRFMIHNVGHTIKGGTNIKKHQECSCGCTICLTMMYKLEAYVVG